MADINSSGSPSTPGNNDAKMASEGNETTGTNTSHSTAQSNAGTSSTGTSAGAQRPASISEALKLIDDVIKRDGANLREMVTNEYEGIRRAIDNVAPNMGEHVTKYGSQAVDAISTYAAQGLDQGKKIATQVDTKVRANPWALIGGVALSSLALGFMLGALNKSKDKTVDGGELH